jgi:DNA-binding response OmpR family regulator
MTSQYCVVSVEDDLGIFNIIQASLRQLPIELHHATTGRDALTLINRCQPSLVILDISLPDMNGWDVLQGISKLEIQKPKVLVLTAFTNPTHRLIGHLQSVAYMNKPFLPRELSTMVSEVLEIR